LLSWLSGFSGPSLISGRTRWSSWATAVSTALADGSLTSHTWAWVVFALDAHNLIPDLRFQDFEFISVQTNLITDSSDFGEKNGNKKEDTEDAKDGDP
jgi:hypothetical protein